MPDLPVSSEADKWGIPNMNIYSQHQQAQAAALAAAHAAQQQQQQQHVPAVSQHHGNPDNNFAFLEMSWSHALALTR